MLTETVLEQHVEITPSIAGGKPRIAGHRIAIQNVVIWHEWMGLSADEIATLYNLSLSEIYAALSYYYDHRVEIDDSIETDAAFVEELHKVIPSKLPEKLRVHAN